MTWMFATLGGYALNAVASVFDKFLLSEKRIGAPALYAFFLSLTNLPFFALIPFGFVYFFPAAIAFGIGSGFVFLYGLLVSYQAIKRSEVSRAVPLVGVASVGFLFLLSLGMVFFSGKGISMTDILALGLLVGGAILLATGGQGVNGPGFVRSVLLSGALLAVAMVLLKESYLFSNFPTGFVWSKVGVFAGGMSLFFVPSFREAILSSHDRFSSPGKRKAITGLYFLLTQVFGGIGTILVSYAVWLGSATFVQGMSGVQYGLVFVFATILSARYPHVFREHISSRQMARKMFAIVMLALGIWLVSNAGLDGFL
ncbi:MAG: hypothetical protein WCJ25_05315 [Candidatus Moraniibacteriota bacterium]